MFGKLVPLGGGDDIPLKKKELIVGRKDECDVVLRFTNVSGRHCKFVLSSGYWYVVDLNSSNGVKVNGVRVTDRRIDPGVTVSIANHQFQLDYSPTANGAFGAPPPDMLDADVFSKSLLERIGMGRGNKKNYPGTQQPAEKPKTGSLKKKETKEEKKEIDFSAYTSDDVDFR